jgi:hypothetical protein
MADLQKFKDAISAGYETKGDYIVLGAAMLDGAAVEGFAGESSFKNI